MIYICRHDDSRDTLYEVYSKYIFFVCCRRTCMYYVVYYIYVYIHVCYDEWRDAISMSTPYVLRVLIPCEQRSTYWLPYHHACIVTLSEGIPHTKLVMFCEQRNTKCCRIISCIVCMSTYAYGVREYACMRAAVIVYKVLMGILLFVRSALLACSLACLLLLVCLLACLENTSQAFFVFFLFTLLLFLSVFAAG